MSLNITLIKDVLIPVFTILISVALAIIIPKWTINREREHGKYQSFEIVNRFYIVMFNSVELLPTGFAGAKKGEKDFEILINSIKSIQMDFAELSSNPFFLELLKEYPEFSMINYSLLSYISELEYYRKNVGSELETKYNTKLIVDFKKLYDQIHNSLPAKIKNRDAYKQLHQIVIDFDRVFNSMK